MALFRGVSGVKRLDNLPASGRTADNAPVGGRAGGGEESRLRDELALRESCMQQRELAAAERQVELDRRARELAKREAAQAKAEVRIRRKLQSIKQRFGDLGLSQSGETTLSPDVLAAIGRAALRQRPPQLPPAKPAPVSQAPQLPPPTEPASCGSAAVPVVGSEIVRLHAGNPPPSPFELERKASELRREEESLRKCRAAAVAEAARLTAWAAELDAQAADLAIREREFQQLRRPQGKAASELRSPDAAVSEKPAPVFTLAEKPAPVGPLPAGFAFRPVGGASPPSSEGATAELQARVKELEQRLFASYDKEFRHAAAVADVLARYVGDLARSQSPKRVSGE